MNGIPVVDSKKDTNNKFGGYLNVIFEYVVVNGISFFQFAEKIRNQQKYLVEKLITFELLNSFHKIN